MVELLVLLDLSIGWLKLCITTLQGPGCLKPFHLFSAIKFSWKPFKNNSY